ncbi:PE-PPE domain-containing protein [Gordonia sp. NPDC003376]
MNRIRKTVGSTAVGCALCLGTVVPTALSSTTALAAGLSTQAGDELGATGVFRPTDAYVAGTGTQTDWLGTVLPGLDDSTILVVTPGTDDGTLYERIRVLRTDDRPTYIIDYPEALGPVVSGRSGLLLPFTAPTYDESRDIAVAKNLQAMAAFGADSGAPHVVYTGYSQGAEAVGNAAEQAVASGGIDEQRSTILLISDPRSPWGLKKFIARSPAVAPIAGAVGAESNGARDPGSTGDDLDVVSVIIVGDPVSNFQWVWYRPVSSLVVDLAGFLTIHSGGGSENYGTVDQFGEPTELHSTDGNTTYLVYHTTHHPLTLLAQMILTDIGITPSDADLERWDKANHAFYPLQEPTPANAGVPVENGPRDAGSRAAAPTTADSTDNPPVTTPGDATEPAVAPPVPEGPGGRHGLTAGQEPTVTVPDTDISDRDLGTAGAGRHRIIGTGRHAAPEPPDETAPTPTASDPAGPVGTPGENPDQGPGARADTSTTATDGAGDDSTGDDSTGDDSTGGHGPAGGGDVAGDNAGAGGTERPAA